MSAGAHGIHTLPLLITQMSAIGKEINIPVLQTCVLPCARCLYAVDIWHCSAGVCGYPVTKTSGFPGTFVDPAIDRVLLHQAVRLPLRPWSRWVAGLTQ
jgi:hypothetical protein